MYYFYSLLQSQSLSTIDYGVNVGCVIQIPSMMYLWRKALYTGVKDLILTFYETTISQQEKLTLGD